MKIIMPEHHSQLSHVFDYLVCVSKNVLIGKYYKNNLYYWKIMHRLSRHPAVTLVLFGLMGFRLC